MPYRVARAQYPDMAAMDSREAMAERIARQNATYLREKYMRLGGVLFGYHGTSSSNAVAIEQHGFRRTRNEELRLGVSAWDAVVPQEAARFALRRSQEAGENDGGMILRVRMVQPHEDEWNGRLEWLSHHKHTEVLEVYSPEAFQEAYALGRLALMDGEDYPTGGML